MNSRTAIASAIALVSTLAASAPAFADDAPPAVQAPPAAESPRRPIPELALSGALVFGLTYGTTIGVTRAATDPQDRNRATAYAAIPVVGPWVMLGSSLPNATYWPALLASGIGQAGGVALAVVGLVGKKDVPMPTIASDKVRVTFVPAGTGGAILGTF